VSDADEVLAVLDRFRAGWEALDAEDVLACFAHDPQISVIGTDEGEYWRGYDALVKPFREMVGAFSNPVYSWAGSPHVTIHEDVAWADGVLDTQLSAGGASLSVRMRTSWVLRRNRGWKVVQAHFSVAPPAPVVAY
jgi:ketosteroid isomerase-like protein